jgi:hypothetical protein
LIISLFQRLRGLGEHRCGHESSHSWKRTKDLDVTVLALLCLGCLLHADPSEQVLEMLL